METGQRRTRAFTATVGLFILVFGGYQMPALADNRVRLSKPEVSRNGEVHTHFYGVVGDPDGWYTKFAFSVFQAGKKVDWHNGSKLAPGRYRLVAKAWSRWKLLKKSMPETRIWQTEKKLKRGWSYTLSAPEMSTQYQEAPWTLPAKVVYNGDPSRPDQPVHRYYFARYSETCGKYPYFACYAYYDENSVKQEVPADQAEILDLTKVPGSDYYGWKPEYLWPYAGVLGPTGTYWVYGEQSGTRMVPNTFTATVTRTYRQPAIGATYVSTVSKVVKAAKWGTLEQYQDWLIGKDPFDLGTINLTRSPKRFLGRASVVFIVKPPAPRKPPDSDTGVYYENCTDARNHGAAPLYRGDPGYGPHLDRDGDGVACEY